MQPTRTRSRLSAAYPTMHLLMLALAGSPLATATAAPLRCELLSSNEAHPYHCTRGGAPAAVGVGFGRIVVSEIEAPNMLVNLL